jgi:protein involved in ribonucleotide reduction
MINIEDKYKIVYSDWDWVVHFEKTIANYCGANLGLAVDSNTNAIKLLLEYLKVKNKNIFIPKNTYVSVPSQIIHSGNTPYFVDYEWEGEYQLHPYPIWDSATRFRKGMHTPGTYQILSFHLKKILNIGTGGMILTEDAQFIRWARPKIYDGRDFTKMYVDDDFQSIGYHMYMTPEQAKRGLEIFHSDRIKDYNEDCGSDKTYKDLTKQSIFKDYVDVPKKYKGINLVFQNDYDISDRYIGEIKINKKLISELNKDELENWINILVNHRDHIIFNDLNMDEVLNLSNETIDFLKNNKNSFFLISDVREGNYVIKDSFWKSIKDYRKKHNIPYEKIIVLTNNMNPNSKDVRTISLPFYLINHNLNACLLEHELGIEQNKKVSIVLKSDLDAKKIRNKRFLSYNRSGQRWHRAFMLSKLYKLDILDNTIFSYYENQHFDDKDRFGKLEYIPSEFETLNIDTIDKWDIIKFLVDKYPTKLEHATTEAVSGGHYYFSKKEHYLDTYVSIVNETGVNDKCTFITEKTIRPMFNRHPFIVWGNPHTLKTLRSFGFKTFDWLLDESYDNCENSNERFNMILKEIDRLNKMPILELHKLYYDNLHIMDYNYEHLKTMQINYKLDDYFTKILI